MRIQPYLVLATLLPALVAAGARAEGIAPDELARVKQAEADRIAAVRKVYGAVVAMYGRATGQGGGSGVLIHPDGFALTNFHVVRAAGQSGKGGLADGQLYDWDLVGMDPGGDLAVVRLKGQDAFPAAPLGDSETVRVGDWAMAMGNPFVLAEDQTPTVTLGIVSGVRRFQGGQGGGRMLVYGNCIQVDSSINPGNSGGPLFDIRGRLIGINGRGSFEERGRVNVGVGYAISIEQAKNFLPDLLAGKVCEHATLDATFFDGDKGVVCDAVNTESPVGKLGLRPGDLLLAFDSKPITSANQFLNLVTTCPAGWPVAVRFRHGDQEVAGWLRLTRLPYGQMPQQGPPVQPRIIPPEGPEKKKDAKDEPSPGEDPAEEAPQETPEDEAEPAEKPDPDTPDEPKEGDEDAPDAPDKKPGPVRVARPAQPQAKPGEIMDAKRNREICGWLLEQYVAMLGGRDAVDRRAERLEKAASFCDDAALGAAMAVLHKEKPLDTFKDIELEGGDRAGGRRAFRLRVRLEDGPACLFWFSVLDDRDAFEIRLLKAARDSEAKGADRAWTFGDYRPVGGLVAPHRVRRVSGLAETVEEEFTVAPPEVLAEAPGTSLGGPALGGPALGGPARPATSR